MRSSTGRRAGISRVYSLKPVTLPTDFQPAWMPCRLRDQHPRRHSRNAQDALVLVREHLDEFRKQGLPVLQNTRRLGTAGEFAVANDQLPQGLYIARLADFL